MPREKAAKFTCAMCGKSFGMAMHLGRHMTTIHSRVPKANKAAKQRRAAKIIARKNGRVGRPPGVVGRLGLRDMSLEELVEVMATAKEEGQRRLAELRQVLLSAPPNRVGRPPGHEAAGPKAPAQAKRRARRKFKVSGTESILAFVRQAGNQGAATAEIVAHWKSEKRAGDGYTALGELVKAKQLKKTPLKNQRGSRYTAA